MKCECLTSELRRAWYHGIQDGFLPYTVPEVLLPERMAPPFTPLFHRCEQHDPSTNRKLGRAYDLNCKFIKLHKGCHKQPGDSATTQDQRSSPHHNSHLRARRDSHHG